MRAFKVRRNGEQYYRVDLPRNLFTDGKRHSVMAVTRKEAIDKAQDTIARRRKGLDYSAAQTPLTDFLKRFLEYYKTEGDRKSTRLNSSHVKSSYAVFCLKKKNVAAGFQ